MIRLALNTQDIGGLSTEILIHEWGIWRAQDDEVLQI